MKLAWLALLILAISGFIPAGERLNGIYLGEDVTGSGGGATCVWIESNGTVTVYVGSLVPGIKDKYGRDVRVKRVNVVR